MMDLYEHNFGASFGFKKHTESGLPSGYSANDAILNGLYTHYHSFRDYGLYPSGKPVIEAPEVQYSEIEIEGRDGALDTTEAADGIVHYFNREGTFEFVSFERDKWDSIYHRLMRDLHGQKREIIIDEEPDGYYYGRLSVDKPKYERDGSRAYFSITANLQPYKLGFSTSIEDWLWDPFNFETDVVPDYINIAENPPVEKPLVDISVTTGSEIQLYGSDMPIVPDINVVDGSLSVKWNETMSSIELSTGSNIEKLYNLVLHGNEPITLKFTGSGTINIEYKFGWF